MAVGYTNVISESRKVRSGKADPNVVRWGDSIDPIDLYLSAITAAATGVRRRDGPKRTPSPGGPLQNPTHHGHP